MVSMSVVYISDLVRHAVLKAAILTAPETWIPEYRVISDIYDKRA
jgi:hypothetical protein